MQKKIEQQNKTIEYIKKLYKQKTGEDVVMPMSWEQSLGIQEGQTPSLPFPTFGQQERQIVDFRVAIDQLNLPTRMNATKIPLTSFSATNKFHMVEHIDLNGFKDMSFSKQLFRQFLSRIVQMRSLHSLSLKNNGIDENCAQEIQTLFSMKRITRIDLSRNKMGKNCLQIISKNFGHIQWIDISRNYFLFDSFYIHQFLSSVRLNGKIWHICMDLQQKKNLTQLCSFMKIKPQLHSLGLVDSKIDAQSMDLICKVLQQSTTSKNKQKEIRINYLNFSFCYLDRSVFNQLQRAINVNTTLISLDLSNNHLGEDAGISFCKTMESNISIQKINMSGNLLQDNFALSLSSCLQKNQIIQVFDISKNNIGQNGGKSIFETLSNKNDTIESLGAYETNQRIGQELIQKIRKALKINKVSKEIRSKIISEEAQLSVVEISNRQTQAFLQAQYRDFDLLVPIAVSNPIRDDPNKIHIWNFQ